MSYLNERPENNHQAKARAVTIALKRNLFPKKTSEDHAPIAVWATLRMP